jgi:hypothetical protein
MIGPTKKLFIGGGAEELDFLKELPALKRKRGRPKGSKTRRRKEKPGPKANQVLPKVPYIPAGLSTNPLEGVLPGYDAPPVDLDILVDMDALLSDALMFDEDLMPFTEDRNEDTNETSTGNPVLEYVHWLSHLKSKIDEDTSHMEFEEFQKRKKEPNQPPKIMSQQEIGFLLSWSRSLLAPKAKQVEERKMEESFQRSLPPILSDFHEDHGECEWVDEGDDDTMMLEDALDQLFLNMPDQVEEEDSSAQPPRPPLIFLPKGKRRGRPRKRALQSKRYEDCTSQCLLSSFFISSK